MTTTQHHQEHLKELMRRKDKMEEDIKTWFGVLESQGNVGTDQPLVDGQGYPRNDIDVHQVRIARNKIACLQNDHKSLMSEIEQGLLRLHASVKPASSSTEMDTSSLPQQQQQQTTDQPRPFAAVDLVSRGSPAESCGIKIGDAILEFGSVTSSNFTGLSTIGQVVQHSRGRPVRVVVERDGHHQVVLSLTPREWEGRGLLGCNIVPMNN